MNPRVIRRRHQFDHCIDRSLAVCCSVQSSVVDAVVEEEERRSQQANTQYN